MMSRGFQAYWLMRTSRVIFKRNSLTLSFKSCGCRLASLRFDFEIDTLPAIFKRV